MGQPARVLPPLTASQLPDVSRALARNPHPAASPANPSGAPAALIVPFDEDAQQPPKPAGTSYTLGQLVEMVNHRKHSARNIVLSGDVDGPEVDLPWIGGRL